MRPAGKFSLRQGLLAVALAATLLATWWASRLDETPPGRPIPMARPPLVPALPTTAPAAGHRAWPAVGAGLIASPPPPPPAAEAAAAQEAPPLPFRFVGTVGEPGQGFALLFDGRDVVTVRAGERIGDQYRVTRITPSRIEFIHLPTRQRQTLEIADYDPQK